LLTLVDFSHLCLTKSQQSYSDLIGELALFGDEVGGQDFLLLQTSEVSGYILPSHLKYNLS